MLQRPQTMLNVGPEFRQDIRDCIVAKLHSKTFSALRGRLAVGIIYTFHFCNGHYALISTHYGMAWHLLPELAYGPTEETGGHDMQFPMPCGLTTSMAVLSVMD